VIAKLQTGYETKITELERQLDKNKNVSTELATVKNDVVATKQQQFDLDMKNAGFPDWRLIDVSPEFNAWLEGEIPYTNFTKMDAIKDAASRFDSNTVAKFFTDFKATQKTIVLPVDADAQREGNLEKFVAPSTTPVSVTHKTTQTGYTRADYETFMRESAKGKFNPAKWGGKTEEAVELMFDTLISKGELR
jgi:hypothetical protein